MQVAGEVGRAQKYTSKRKSWKSKHFTIRECG